MFPDTRPMLFETLAMTGGYPKASSVGNVISEPDPTTALTAPAAIPAPRIAKASGGPTCSPHDLDRKRGPETPHREQHHMDWASLRRPAQRAPTTALTSAPPAVAHRNTATGSGS